MIFFIIVKFSTNLRNLNKFLVVIKEIEFNKDRKLKICWF
jgi:hypothetical protein